MNSAWSSATFFKFLLLLIAACTLAGCSSFFFYPQKTLLRTPDQLELDYSDIQVSAADGTRLHGWHLKAPQPRGIILFLHGNAENISTHIASVFWLPEQGYDVVMMDYRGYGRSEGKPDFPDVFLDVEAFYLWTRDYARARELPLFVLGQSLGAAITSYYFGNLDNAKADIEGVILDAVFSGHRDIAKQALSRSPITWPLQFVVLPLLPDSYDPKDFIAGLNPVPLLFFHSQQDAVIPYQQGRRVYDNAKPPKYWVTTSGPHIATFGAPPHRRTLLRFLHNPAQNPAPGETGDQESSQ